MNKKEYGELRLQRKESGQTITDRFEQKFIPVPEAGCWLWECGCISSGYGGFYYRGKHIPAHRASWLIYNGEIPDGLCVLHKCDIKICVNPYHLFLGTLEDNNHDCMAKNRHVRYDRHGERNPTAKLTKKDVQSIRADMRTQKDIAKEYGVCQTQISKIKLGLAWRAF